MQSRNSLNLEGNENNIQLNGTQGSYTLLNPISRGSYGQVYEGERIRNNNNIISSSN